MTRDQAAEKLEALKAGKSFDRIEGVLDVLSTLEDHYLELAQSHEQLFTRAPVAILTIDAVGRITAHNDFAADTFIGSNPNPVIYIGRLIDPADNAVFLNLLRLSREQEATQYRDIRVRTAAGASPFARVAIRPLPEGDSCCVTITDIDDLKATEQRLDADARRNKALLRETNHRTKNLLQIIRSSLEIKARSATTTEARHIAEGLRSQVMSLQGAVGALTGKGDLAHVDAGALVAELVRHLSSGLREGISMEFQNEIGGLRMPAEAGTSLSLVVSELCFNAVEHAFPDADTPGTIIVALKRDGEAIGLTVIDDGVGFDGAPGGGGHLGLIIVRDLVEGHLDGTVEWIPQSPGTEVRIRIPYPSDSEDQS